MAFKVIGTDTYNEEINRWDKADKDVAEKLPKKLAENPFLGKPLSFPFLREQKIREKRAYYLIYEDLELVLLVAVSGKKDQQSTINHIKAQFVEFRKIAEEIAKRVS